MAASADSNKSSTSTDSVTSEFAGMSLSPTETRTELVDHQVNDYTVTISLPAHVLPIRIEKANSSNTRYDRQITNSNHAAILPAQQSTSPTSSCQIMNFNGAAAGLPAQQLTSPTSSSPNISHLNKSQNFRKKRSVSMW